MPKIFIVEDDRTITNAMIKEFNKWQYLSQTVQDWNSVVAEIRTFQPDIVIMDITLPTFDGFYWTSQLRQVSDVPVIFVSAADMDPNAVRAIATGQMTMLLSRFHLMY
ncbi:response regulator [Lentilactobacillus kisonensis]|uniref:response regulator n=1 Tax=Lentilactobacillus kisonensis TaxID=481722 RepID=UPI000A402DAB|nr:response regulator [Lentilactobacillus kisonensis]